MTKFKNTPEMNEFKGIEHPPTPAKGEPWPDTKEYWIKRAAMDEVLILKQKKEISRLKQKLNNLRQKKND